MGVGLKVEDFLQQEKVIDLSFFNFENAITAAYFANENLEIQKTNKNFAKFFPILGNVTNAYFPNVLEQLGIPEEQISQFKSQIEKNGSVLIPQIKIIIDGKEIYYNDKPMLMDASIEHEVPTHDVERVGLQVSFRQAFEKVMAVFNTNKGESND